VRRTRQLHRTHLYPRVFGVKTLDAEFKVFTAAGLEVPLSESNLYKLTASPESGETDGKGWTVGIIDLRLASP
jgi:hypothetical protein